MLQSIRQLYKETLHALDGEIGRVNDVYFDDQNWAVRYLVADTGSWISGRLVLLAPHAFGRLHQEGVNLLVNLTRKQIEDSPSIEDHKPISRQYEEEYHQHYGWPSYWMGDLMRGISNFPAQPSSSGPFSDQKTDESDGHHDVIDPHLRSSQAIVGYHIQASDGTIGQVSDIIMDDQSWVILQLVAETGDWLSGKEVLIPITQVDWISHEESKVYVKLTKEAIRDEPEYYLPPVGIAEHPGP